MDRVEWVKIVGKFTMFKGDDVEYNVKIVRGN